MSKRQTADDGISPEEVIEAYRVPRAESTQQYGGDGRSPHDARTIRGYHGLRPFFKQLYQTSDAVEIDTEADAVRFPAVIPDCLVHLRRGDREQLKRDEPNLSGIPRTRRQVLRWLAVDDEARRTMNIGGTDFIGTGPPGSGKSTLGLDLARQIMEINPREAVVWRGTPNRAEWTPLAPWAKVLLPSSTDATAVVDEPYGAEFELDPSEIAREVERYRDVFDALDKIEPGKFHVIYPDPDGRGIEDLFHKSARTDSFDWYQDARPDETPSTPTPLKHWWFGFVVGFVDYLGSEWATLFIDEIGDLLSQSARSGDANHNLYEKIEAYRDALVDARKNQKSIMHFGHNAQDVSDLVRRKIRWRITMPGWANPTEGDSVVGMGEPPMRTDLTSNMNIGRGLWWTAVNFSAFTWSDLAAPTVADVSITLDRGGRTRGVGR